MNFKGFWAQRLWVKISVDLGEQQCSGASISLLPEMSSLRLFMYGAKGHLGNAWTNFSSYCNSEFIILQGQSLTVCLCSDATHLPLDHYIYFIYLG